MRALGLCFYASLSRSTERTKVVLEAWKSYLKAIQQTSKALRSPHAVSQDQPLLSVIMLSLCESIISYSSQRSCDAWRDHVNGVTALVKMRGLGQASTPEGRVPFVQASYNLIWMAVGSGTSLPDDLYTLTKERKHHHSKETDPATWIKFLLVYLCRIYHNLLHGYVDRLDALEQLSKLDERLATDFAAAGSWWQYSLQHLDSSAGIQSTARYADRFHVYRSFTSLQAWNAMRSGRIFCHVMRIFVLRTSPHCLATPDMAGKCIERSAQVIE